MLIIHLAVAQNLPVYKIVTNISYNCTFLDFLFRLIWMAVSKANKTVPSLKGFHTIKM